MENLIIIIKKKRNEMDTVLFIRNISKNNINVIHSKKEKKMKIIATSQFRCYNYCNTFDFDKIVVCRKKEDRFEN